METQIKEQSTAFLTARRAITFAALATTLLPAAASASYGDLRSPDARDTAIHAEGHQAVDLRSPDARQAAPAAQPPHAGSGYVDLRSPDVRDAGRVLQPPAKPAAHPSAAEPGDVTWPYLAGAGVVVSLLLGFAATTGRRRLGRLHSARAGGRVAPKGGVMGRQTLERES